MDGFASTGVSIAGMDALLRGHWMLSETWTFSSRRHRRCCDWMRPRKGLKAPAAGCARNTDRFMAPAWTLCPLDALRKNILGFVHFWGAHGLDTRET